MSQRTDDKAESFDAAVAACRGCDVQIDWWTRGGEPGPESTSDKLTLFARDGNARLTYVRARFDPGYENNYRAMQFSGYVNRSHADEMLAALRADAAFSQHFPAEDRGTLADGVKDTVTVVFKQARFEKTLVEASAGDLAHTKRLRNQLAVYAEQHFKGEDMNRRTAAPASPR